MHYCHSGGITAPLPLGRFLSSCALLPGWGGFFPVVSHRGLRPLHDRTIARRSSSGDGRVLLDPSSGLVKPRPVVHYVLNIKKKLDRVILTQSISLSPVGYGFQVGSIQIRSISQKNSSDRVFLWIKSISSSSSSDQVFGSGHFWNRCIFKIQFG